MNQRKKISLLTATVQNQIAAGEVVENPASIIKELVENSLDANANQIEVRLSQGGFTLLSVHDNGLGIPKDELLLAVTRHATSKLTDINSLEQIASFGFRGEALASIASVSSFSIDSCPKDQESGANISVSFGDTAQITDSSCKEGTQIEIRNLFSTIPARLKFMKTTATESKKCFDAFARIALAHADKTFSLIIDSKQAFHFTPKQNLLTRLESIWKVTDLNAQMSPLEYENQGYKVSGFTSNPGFTRARADRLLFYVNKRPIQDKVLLSAVRQAYKGHIISREYPQAIIFLDIPAQEVDVNVHPAKKEVRFRQEAAIFSTIHRALTLAIQSKPTLPSYNKDLHVSGSTQHTLKDCTNHNALSSQENYLSARNEKVFTKQDFFSKPAQSLHDYQGSDVSHNELDALMQNAAQEIDAVFLNNKAPQDNAQNSQYKHNFDHISLAENTHSAALNNTETHSNTNDSIHTNINEAHSQTNTAHTAHIAAYSSDSNDNSNIFLADSNTVDIHSASHDEEFSHIKENNIQYLGQIACTYLLLKYKESLWILDQHAAHEQVLYTIKQKERTKSQAQKLINPLLLDIQDEEQMMMLEHKSEALKSFGYVFTKDASQIIIEAIPPALSVAEAKKYFLAALEDKGQSLEELWILHSCKNAVKAGTALSEQEALSLIDAWLQIEENREFCPHGRPIVLQFGAVELEKLFKRK